MTNIGRLTHFWVVLGSSLLCQRLQLVQGFQRFARAHGIGIDGCKLRIYCADRYRFSRSRGSKQIHLGLALGGMRFQGLQRVACLVEHRSGHAGQSCHLNALALTGRAALNLMQEHNVAPRLRGADVHVERIVVGGGEFGELEVVGCK